MPRVDLYLAQYRLMLSMSMGLCYRGIVYMFKSSSSRPRIDDSEIYPNQKECVNLANPNELEKTNADPGSFHQSQVVPMKLTRREPIQPRVVPLSFQEDLEGSTEMIYTPEGEAIHAGSDVFDNGSIDDTELGSITSAAAAHHANLFAEMTKKLEELSVEVRSLKMGAIQTTSTPLPPPALNVAAPPSTKFIPPPPPPPPAHLLKNTKQAIDFTSLEQIRKANAEKSSGSSPSSSSENSLPTTTRPAASLADVLKELTNGSKQLKKVKASPGKTPMKGSWKKTPKISQTLMPPDEFFNGELRSKFKNARLTTDSLLDEDDVDPSEQDLDDDRENSWAEKS